MRAVTAWPMTAGRFGNRHRIRPSAKPSFRNLMSNDSIAFETDGPLRSWYCAINSGDRSDTGAHSSSAGPHFRSANEPAFRPAERQRKGRRLPRTSETLSTRSVRVVERGADRVRRDLENAEASHRVRARAQR